MDVFEAAMNEAGYPVHWSHNDGEDESWDISAGVPLRTIADYHQASYRALCLAAAATGQPVPESFEAWAGGNWIDGQWVEAD
ncbi:MAG: hypothetical protein IT195_12440 [Microthrixaceae bacterium]|nr:hypothetical protein [Microthrixaceae bacterium]